MFFRPLATAAPLASERVLRVLTVCHSGELGGAERSLVDLIEGARAVAPVAGVEVTEGSLGRGIHYYAVLPGPGPLATALERAQVPVFFCSSMTRLERRPRTLRFLPRLLAASMELRELAAQLRVDLVHANSATAALFAAFVDCPLVWHVRDLRLGAEVRWLAQRGATAIAPSWACARALRARATHARIRLVHNGIDVERFAARRSVPTREPRETLLALCISQLVPWKGHELLLDAVRLVREQGIRLEVTVLGGAACDESGGVERWRSRVREAQLLGVVEFAGAVGDVGSWLARSDLLIHPAYPEPFGRVIVEALAASVPVVALGGAHGPDEILAGSEAGWLVRSHTPQALAQTIVAALTDSLELCARGAKGPEHARRYFSRERMAREVAQVYHETIAARGLA